MLTFHESLAYFYKICMFWFPNKGHAIARPVHLKFRGLHYTALAMSENQNSDFERKLQGRTLNVYLYLQRKKEPSGIREVQRDLGLSSPSVADYQVEKLVEMGLAARDTHGRVYVTKHVRVKALQSYVSLGNHTVPRLAFYASIFTAIAALYVLFSFESFSIYGVAVPAAAAAIFWYEAAKLWKIGLLQRAHSAKQYDNSDFWASLLPGIAALAAFIAAAFFLFYYVEPSDAAQIAPPLVDPNRHVPDSSSQPMTAADLLRLSPDVGAGSHGELISNFPPSLVTGFLFAGALVAGFLVYVLVRYRSNDDVLQVERC